MEETQHKLSNYGYAVVDGLPDEGLESFAKTFGEIVVDPRSPEKIRDIRPEIASESNPNTLSHIHGTGAFPFHSDCAHWKLPAKYLLLYCVNPGRGKRRTLLIDTNEWIWSKEEKGRLRNEVWRRALKEPCLCTVIDVEYEQEFLRFDEACMSPMSKTSESLLREIKERIRGSSVIDIEWVQGRVLVIDNHRMLHARANSVLPDPDRILKRVLIGTKP